MRDRFYLVGWRRLGLLLCLCAWLPAARASVGFAGYVEGRGFDKALLLGNTGDRPLDMNAGDWRIALYFNGAQHPGQTIRLRGVLPAHGRSWLVNAGASARLRAAAEQLSSNLNFNGNDAVVLFHGHRVIDSLWRVGEDPGAYWGDHGVRTRGVALRRDIRAIGSNPI